MEVEVEVEVEVEGRRKMSEIERQLKEKIIELEQIRKVREHVQQLRERLAVESKMLAGMEKTLLKEQKDVTSLEKEGFQAMLHKFLGDREKKLTREREEYIRAALRYNELFKSVELIKYELDILEKKEHDVDLVKFQMEELIKKREGELLRENSLEAAELKAIFDRIDWLHKLSVDVDEAYESGQKVFGYTKYIENYLVEAKSDFIPHALYHARDMSFRGRHAYIKFKNDLADVYPDLAPDLDLNIEEHERVPNIFIVDIIHNLIIHQKIKRSLENVSRIRILIESLLTRLENEKIKVNDQLKYLSQKKRDLILKS